MTIEQDKILALEQALLGIKRAGDGLVVLPGLVKIGSRLVVNGIVQAGDPSADADLTTKSYVDTNFASNLHTHPTWTFLTTPLTSTSWDGDARSTTSKTLIDLSSVFNVPAGVKAILIRIACRDSASSGASTWFGVSASNTASEFAVMVRCGGVANDYYIEGSGICPCDANGDIYYQCAASGSGTLDVVVQIWGYFI